MKCLNRNKVAFFYALYEGREPIMNAQGRPSGQHKVIHSNPIKAYANISAAKGETQTRQFGENELYDKVIVMDIGSSSIDEYSILWVDTVPKLNEDGSLMINESGEAITPHNYVVKQVAKGLNSVMIGISKVVVSG